jgi:hypothetical protein
MNIEHWDKYLGNLRKLPFVLGAEIQAEQPSRNRARQDAILELKTPTGTYEFLVELKKTNLTYALVEVLLKQQRELGRRTWILFAPHIGKKMAGYLAERAVNFIDRAGNCFLAIGKNHVAIIEGRPPAPQAARARGLGAPGHQVLFAILAEPDLLNVPTRTLAALAGVGKTAAANTLRRLEEERLIAKGAQRRYLLRRGQILERWIAGYANIVRPRLTIGRYRTPHPNPRALEQRIAKALKNRVEWGWGGGAAAERLDPYYRGKETVIHLANTVYDLEARIQAIPDRNGPLTILLAPGEVALRGAAPHTVHPLLVYTELVVAHDERALEAANRIRDKYLWKGER